MPLYVLYRFLHEGRRVKDDMTPEILDMEEADEIQVFNYRELLESEECNQRNYIKSLKRDKRKLEKELKQNQVEKEAHMEKILILLSHNNKLETESCKKDEMIRALEYEVKNLRSMDGTKTKDLSTRHNQGTQVKEDSEFTSDEILNELKGLRGEVNHQRETLQSIYSQCKVSLNLV